MITNKQERFSFHAVYYLKKLLEKLIRFSQQFFFGEISMAEWSIPKAAQVGEQLGLVQPSATRS